MNTESASRNRYLSMFGAALLCAMAAAQSPENIALGASYTLEPRPNYEHCTDDGDARQLTDGAYTEGHFWTQPSTVGWKSARPVIIVIDLGAPRAICGVSYSTAAGAAGVTWPEAILLFTAGEDQVFYDAGELVGLSAAATGNPPEGAYATHRFRTNALETWGRYVALGVWASPYIFVDEIEIYAGHPDWLNAPRTGQPITDLAKGMERLAVHAGVRRRIERDVAEVSEKLTAMESAPDARTAIAAELDRISEAVLTLPIDYPEDFRTVMPLNDLHARVFRAHAALWRAEGRAPVTVWTSNLWDPLELLADPPENAAPAMSVAMMLNEYRAAAFNVSNAGETDVYFELRVRGLPGGVSPGCVTVYEVAWTDTQTGTPVAAALIVPAREGEAYRIGVPSGMTRQVWLTFHPTDLEPGRFQAHIELQSGEQYYVVPLTLALYPLRFPERPALHCGGWDYTNSERHYGVTPENRDAFIAHLREHFVDTPWATAAALPHGTYDDAGNLAAPPDTANFDEWLRRWPGAGLYCVFASVGNSCGKWSIGAPEFDVAVQSWIRFWADYAQSKGVAPGKLALLLVDEPRDQEQDAIILAWAKAIHAAGTGVCVWEDPIYKDMSLALQESVEAWDVLCPNRVIFLNADPAYRDYFTAQRARGKILEFYSCSGPVRLLDPYRYFRLQAWDCWRYGATATHFWAFGDNSGVSSWNEYAAPRNMYTPLFLDAKSVTPGKHMEAIRESIEDYEYLVMLERAIADAEARNAPPEVIAQARRTLESWPDRVCNAGASLMFLWAAEGADRTLADQARVAVLESLALLTAGTT